MKRNSEITIQTQGSLTKFLDVSQDLYDLGNISTNIATILYYYNNVYNIEMYFIFLTN